MNGTCSQLRYKTPPTRLQLLTSGNMDVLSQECKLDADMAGLRPNIAAEQSNNTYTCTSSLPISRSKTQFFFTNARNVCSKVRSRAANAIAAAAQTPAQVRRRPSQ
jgi:hypothetical protein